MPNTKTLYNQAMQIPQIPFILTNLNPSTEHSTMLAIFHKTVADPPSELLSPTTVPSKHPDDILRAFHATHPSSFSATFPHGAALAWSRTPSHRRLFCTLDGISCLFVGSLTNLSALIRDYGLCCRTTDEAMLVVEVYRTLRDRGPYPADQVIKGLEGKFGFVLFDGGVGSVFAALSGDGAVPMWWGVAADGSVVVSDVVEVVKGGCGKSFAPFPTGCMFHSVGGLKSFEHPLNKMKAMPRVDSEGVMCGASFKVDKYSRINSMPRVGSATNWTDLMG